MQSAAVACSIPGKYPFHFAAESGGVVVDDRNVIPGDGVALGDRAREPDAVRESERQAAYYLTGPLLKFAEHLPRIKAQFLTPLKHERRHALETELKELRMALGETNHVFECAEAHQLHLRLVRPAVAADRLLHP